jgi:hypothetical protein
VSPFRFIDLRRRHVFSRFFVVQDARGLQERLLRLEEQTALQEESRGRGPQRADRGDTPQKQRDLWLPAGTRRVARFGSELWSPQSSQADAQSRTSRLLARQEEADHPPRSPGYARPRPREQELPCHRPGQALDSRDITYVKTDEGFLHLAFSC